ncbi:MAG: L,D-transpeptidase [Lachnospiraceae bacterium]|nr:L,D-transpeptidase [Lachnospiraceae bacterium]
MKTKLSTIFAVIFIAVFNGVSVYAADFDAGYYAQRYPDVANTIGCGEKALYDHYINEGRKEGRYPNALAECEGRAREIELQNAAAKGNTEAIKLLANASEESLPLQPQITQSSVTVLQTASDARNAAIIATVQATGTFVDVDIANQTISMYVNGLPVLVSPCVTGTPKDGRSTPTGSYYILEKIPGKRLKGESWDVWVDRWMRFTNNRIGLHDASWRSKFGGEIYKSNGSHGCVNIPKDAAYMLYDMVSVGTPVIVR